MPKKVISSIAVITSVMIITSCSGGYGTKTSVKGKVNGREVERKCSSHAMEPVAYSKGKPGSSSSGSKSSGGSERGSSGGKSVPSDSGKDSSNKRCDKEYELDIKTRKGSIMEENVSRKEYENCEVGEKYPRCTKG